jgi:Protein of unknown function (DUF4231)
MGLVLRRNPQIKTACERLGKQIDLSEGKFAYWEERWSRETVNMWLRLDDSRTRFYSFKITSVIASVLIPALVALNLDAQASLTVRWITFALSVLAGIATAISGLTRTTERWILNRRYLNPLYREGVQFATLTAAYRQYSTHELAFEHFTSKIEDLLANFDSDYEHIFLRNISEESYDQHQEAAGGQQRNRLGS